MANKEIRSILAAMADGHVLLPNSAVAEVLEFTPPKPLKKSPAWLLGELAWHGWQVPVISFQRLIDDKAGDAVTRQARILIIKTLGESTQVIQLEGRTRRHLVRTTSIRLGRWRATRTGP